MRFIFIATGLSNRRELPWTHLTMATSASFSGVNSLIRRAGLAPALKPASLVAAP